MQRKNFGLQKFMSLQTWESLGSRLLNLFIFGLLFFYLFPIISMISTAFMEGSQLGDRNAPVYPARQIRFEYQGKEYNVYNVPFEDGSIRQLAMVKPGRTSSQFVDPQNPEAGLIE